MQAEYAAIKQSEQGDRATRQRKRICGETMESEEGREAEGGINGMKLRLAEENFVIKRLCLEYVAVSD